MDTLVNSFIRNLDNRHILAAVYQKMRDETMDTLVNSCIRNSDNRRIEIVKGLLRRKR